MFSLQPSLSSSFCSRIIFTQKTTGISSAATGVFRYSHRIPGVLGTNSPEGGIIDYQYSIFGLQTSIDSLAQPMKFDFARFHQSVSIKITDGFYAGLGYQFDSYFKIVDEKLRLNPGDTILTSHYAYNDYYGFNKNQYFSSALNVNLILDTRDNMINAYKGVYAMVSWRGGLKMLGNKENTNYAAIRVEKFSWLIRK